MRRVAALGLITLVERRDKTKNPPTEMVGVC